MVIEQELPLYRIRCYGDYLYRVTKRLFNPNRVSVKDNKSEPSELPEGKFDSALSRAKNVVREVALCNRWEYFVTLTFDKEKWDRYSLGDRLKEFLQWVQNQNKYGSRIRYVLVPEFHKDGAVHFHALMSGIEVAPRPDWWPQSVNLKKDGTYYDYWPAYSERYGYSAVERIHDPVAVGFYISKYITKSLGEAAAFKGVHTYYRSKGLQTSFHVGDLYHGSCSLDKVCKFSNSFYSFGFCKCDDIGYMVDMCDEVASMYKNYVITDPVSGELVAVVGSEEGDAYVQTVLAEFMQSGLCCSVWDMPD